MEKISGILPSSSRITTVDLKGSQPARPGGPLFGRPVGVSSLAAPKVTTDVFESASGEHENLLSSRVRTDRNSQIAQNITDSFFQRRVARAEEDRIQLEKNPMEVKGFDEVQISWDDIANAEEQKAKVFDNFETSSIEEDLDAPEVGRHLDVVA